jgi:hypothetical protein
MSANDDDRSTAELLGVVASFARGQLAARAGTLAAPSNDPTLPASSSSSSSSSAGGARQLLATAASTPPAAGRAPGGVRMGGAGRALVATAALTAAGWSVATNGVTPATEILPYRLLEWAAEVKISAEMRAFRASNGASLLPTHAFPGGHAGAFWSDMLPRWWVAQWRWG